MDRTDCRPSPNRHRCTHLRAKDEADGLHTCLFFSFFFLLKEKRIYMYLFPPFFFDGQPRRFQFHGRRRDHLWSRSRAKKIKFFWRKKVRWWGQRSFGGLIEYLCDMFFFSSSSPLPSRRLMTRARKLHSRQVRCQQTRCDYMRGEKNWPATGSPWLPVVHTSDPYVLCAVVFVLVLLHYSSHVADSQEDD